ncbi:MAG: hypothetical protein ACP5US_09030 [Candidatus Kryptoniota bacterium]
MSTAFDVAVVQNIPISWRTAQPFYLFFWLTTTSLTDFQGYVRVSKPAKGTSRIKSLKFG